MELYPRFARCEDLKTALVRTYTEVQQQHTLQMAAALSYYFVLSLFPALIFLSAAVAYLPVPDLFNQTLTAMGYVLPADTMGLVSRILADVISPKRGAFFSFGILGALWAASGGFAAMIEALNIAYQVEESRRPSSYFVPIANPKAIASKPSALLARGLTESRAPANDAPGERNTNPEVMDAGPQPVATIRRPL